jgi:hypothetical protein
LNNTNTTNNSNLPSSANHHTSSAYNSLSYLFNNIKKRERNLLSACCAVFSIAILSVSLVETRWFFFEWRRMQCELCWSGALFLHPVDSSINVK